MIADSIGPSRSAVSRRRQRAITSTPMAEATYRGSSLPRMLARPVHKRAHATQPAEFESQGEIVRVEPTGTLVVAGCAGSDLSSKNRGSRDLV